MTDTIILENQNLVYAIINKYYPNYSNKNDLFQAGCLGLVKASKQFKESFNTKFSSYAYLYIVGEIKNFIRENKSIKIGHDFQKLAYKLEKVRIMLTQKYMREPTTEELSVYLNIPEYMVIELLNIPNSVTSLDETYNSDEKISLYECIGDNKSSSIDDLICLKQEYARLDDKEKQILKARYFDDLSQNEISQKMNMSQVQVSRYEKKVLTKLRNRLM